MLLMQSENAAQHLTIQIKADSRPLRPDIPYTVRCRVRGERDGNHHNVILEAVEAPRRASLSDAPKRLTMLNTLRNGVTGGRAAADFSPFADLDGVRDEIAAKLASDGMPADVVDEMLRPTQKGAGMQRFVNHVVLSGFVGHKAYYPAADGAPADHGYCLFVIHQHADPDRAIPVRVRGADSRFLKLLPVMHPVNVVAELRVDTQPDRDSGEPVRLLTLEATRENVGGAVASDFEHDKFPHWWADAVKAHHANRLATLRDSRAAADAVAAGSAVAAQQGPVADDTSADEMGIKIVRNAGF